MNFVKHFTSKKYMVVTPENMENVSFKNISFKRGITVEDILYEETDYEHPFVIHTSFGGELYVNEEWYISHLEEGREFLKKLVLKNQAETLDIYSNLFIDDSILDAIKEAGVVKKLDLGSEYCLTSATYKKLRDSSVEVLVTGGVEDSLKDIYEPFIAYNWKKDLIGWNSYEQLIKAKFVKVTKEEEVEYFHLLPLNCEVTVKSQNLDLLNKVLATNHPGTIVIEVEDKITFNKYLKAHPIENQNVVVLVNYEKTPLSLYMRLEETLDNMVKGAEGLSPLEKYLYVYNIVKQYKEYKENEEDRRASRNLYQILQNEYMVCVGFSTMLIDLCTRIGIPACSISTAVDVSYDKSDAGKEQLEIPKPMEKGHHARTQVYIQDPKYKIDGYYLADATWDNDLKHDAYLFTLLSVEERLANSRSIVSDYLKGEEYFDCQNLDIFYAKVNRALDLLESKKEEKKKPISTGFLGELEARNKEREKIRNLKKIVDAIIEKLCALNPEYVAKLKEQYPGIEDEELATRQDYYNVITELGNHIVPMCNKAVNGVDLFRAIKEVYARSNGYTGEELSARLAETMSYNKKAYEKHFPTRTREYQDGNTDIYKSVPNKFDIELPPGWAPKPIQQQVEEEIEIEEEFRKLR